MKRMMSFSRSATTEDVDQRYMVIMDGTLISGADRTLVIKKLSRLFGSTTADVDALLQGEPLVIKKNLPARRAHQYFRTITNAGADCHVEEYNPEDYHSHSVEDNLSSSGRGNTEERNEIRRKIRERINQLEETGQFQVDDLTTHRTHDKIIFISSIILIFGLLAAIYLIV